METTTSTNWVIIIIVILIVLLIFSSLFGAFNQPKYLYTSENFACNSLKNPKGTYCWTTAGNLLANNCYNVGVNSEHPQGYVRSSKYLSSAEIEQCDDAYIYANDNYMCYNVGKKCNAPVISRAPTN